MENVKEIENKLLDIFKGKYSSKNFVGITSEEAKNYIDEYIKIKDWKMEGYSEYELDLQRDREFTWGHHHDFGDFKMEGRMGNRHAQVMAYFMNDFGLPFDFFRGKVVLDVGCWTGGTTLMLAAMDVEEVYSIEEVKKQAHMAKWLTKVFGLTVKCYVTSESLYEIKDENEYDIVYFPGVLYHLSDIIVGLRRLFNSLKVGGTMLLETGARKIQATNSSTSPADKGRYILYSGSQRGGWNWFIPSIEALIAILEDVGFENIEAHYYSATRVICKVMKNNNKGMCKAGLSAKDL